MTLTNAARQVQATATLPSAARAAGPAGRCLPAGPRSSNSLPSGSGFGIVGRRLSCRSWQGLVVRTEGMERR
jgi:hypothetical protein